MGFIDYRNKIKQDILSQVGIEKLPSIGLPEQVELFSSSLQLNPSDDNQNEYISRHQQFEQPSVELPFIDLFNNTFNNDAPYIDYDFSDETGGRSISFSKDKLIHMPIEDVFNMAGITSVNGKKIKFGNSAIRSQNASVGVKNSWHKILDQYTNTASARDISIVNGDIEDYEDFKKMILSNQLVMQYLHAKNWGIINEITPSILAKTNGTGKHFHFGPDKWAVRTLKHWLNNPSTPVTQYIKASKGIKLISKK